MYVDIMTFLHKNANIVDWTGVNNNIPAATDTIQEEVSTITKIVQEEQRAIDEEEEAREEAEDGMDTTGACNNSGSTSTSTRGRRSRDDDDILARLLPAVPARGTSNEFSGNKRARSFSVSSTESAMFCV